MHIEAQFCIPNEPTSTFGVVLFVTLSALCPKFNEHFVSLVCRIEDETQIYNQK